MAARTRHRPSRSSIRALTLDEVAEILAVSRRTVNAWIASGRIQVVRIGPSTPRVLESDLDMFLRQKREEGMERGAK